MSRKRHLADADLEPNRRPFKQTLVNGVLVPASLHGVRDVKDSSRPVPVDSGYGGAMRVRPEDAFHASLQPHVTQNLIRSNGREQPMHQQSSIVQTVMVKKNEYDRRAKTLPENMIAPLGDRQDHSVQPGDIVFSPAEATTTHPLQSRNRPRSIHDYGDVVVSSTVNGLDRNEKGTFRGVAVTVSDAADMNSDTAATVLTFGTATIVNTGPQTFQPHDLARMSLTPFVAIQGGKMVPAIEQKGVPKMKFRPAIYPYNAATMKNLGEKAAEAAVAASVEIFKTDPTERDQTRQPLNNVGNDAYVQKAEQTCRDFNRIAYLDGTDHPIHMFIRYGILSPLAAGMHLAAEGKAEVPNDNEPVLAAAYRLVRNYWEAEKSKSNVKTGNMFLSILDPPELETESASNLYTFIEKRKASLLIDQEHELLGSVIGRVLNFAPPGKPVDLAINMR